MIQIVDEFDFIKNYLAPLAGPEGLNLQDDAALFTPRANYDLVITKDSLVEGVHFPKGDYSANTAHKLIAVNLSDLAAKGAKPLGYLLSIAWPDDVNIVQTMELFSKRFNKLQQAYDFKLFGGDTVKTNGPMVISATFIGEVPKGKMVQRSGAKSGDDVWVSGTIGDGYLGLLHVLDEDLKSPLSPAQKEDVKSAFYRPEPRLIMSEFLQKHATASVDISDGLLSDLGHIATASHISLDIELDKIPLSPAAVSWIKTDIRSRTISLITAGDDYEIGFTAPNGSRQSILNFAKNANMKLSRIGEVNPISSNAASKVKLIDSNGERIETVHTGYKHKLL